MPAAVLLEHTRQLFGIVSPASILQHTGAVARELTDAHRAFVSFLRPGEPWARGLHLRVDDAPGELSPRARSALFALFRRVVRGRRSLTLHPSDETAAIFAGLGEGLGASSIHACPILRGGGRVAGALVVVAGDSWSPDAPTVTIELARTAAIALDNAQRFAMAKRDQDRMLLLAEATDEALWDWNIDASELWWGGSIHELLGGGSRHVTRNPAWRFERAHPDDVERVRASLDVALCSTASFWREKYRFRRADGSWLVVEDRAFFLREADGRAYRAIGALRDITPLEQLLERERQARADAETASRAKDEFLAMLGHELRNPLAPIVTAVQLIRQRAASSIERELDVVERQARHLVRLVDDLLDVSRITRGKIELKKERIELAEAVAKAIEMTLPLIEQRRHVLEVEVPREGLAVDADPARLAQVISNLLTNAAKYSDPGGRIAVVGRAAAPWVEVCVKDTGIGIAPEVLPHVFDTFVQERQGIERSQGGLGLGLSIVRSLTTLHGGTVHAHSEGPGLGAELTVRLPCAAERSEEAASTAERRAPMAGCGRRILIVDDNEDAAMMLAELLALMGGTTRVAHDGPSALRVAEEFEPELALLDIGLPVMDGYELARRLRQRRDGPLLRLVAVTGYGQEADRRRAVEASFDAHLVKPVTFERLQRVLAEL